MFLYFSFHRQSMKDLFEQVFIINVYLEADSSHPKANILNRSDDSCLEIVHFFLLPLSVASGGDLHR